MDHLLAALLIVVFCVGAVTSRIKDEDNIWRVLIAVCLAGIVGLLLGIGTGAVLWSQTWGVMLALLGMAFFAAVAGTVPRKDEAAENGTTDGGGA